MANIGDFEVIKFLTGLESILHDYDEKIKLGTAVAAASEYLTQ